jgi:hypothetical protein
LGPASLSMLATRSSERVNDVLAFILPLYYQGKTLANTAGALRVTMASWKDQETYRQLPAEAV